MPHFIRVNMTTGNVRSLPLSPERNQLGGRALVSQVLYTEMAPNTDPLGADNSLVLAAGLLVGQPLSCFDELVLGSKSPDSGLLASVRFMSRAARMMAGMGIRFGVIEGRAANDRQHVLLMEYGRASLIPLESIVHPSAISSSFDTHKALQEYFGRNTCIVSVGSAAFSSSPLAALLVSGSENESLKTIPGHGMARVMASKGLCAFIFRSSESLTEKRSPVEKMLCRDAAKLLRCARQEYSLETTPFGQSSFCRYCLDGQYSKHQGWQSTCADMGFYPPAVSSIVPDIAKKSEDELRNTLHRLMEECPSSLQESPLHSLLPPPAILAAYDSVGLCPLAPLPDTDERLLNIIASLAKNSHGGIWSAESILRVGAETINRENAFNTWALA